MNTRLWVAMAAAFGFAALGACSNMHSRNDTSKTGSTSSSTSGTDSSSTGTTRRADAGTSSGTYPDNGPSSSSSSSGTGSSKTTDCAKDRTQPGCADQGATTSPDTMGNSPDTPTPPPRN